MDYALQVSKQKARLVDSRGQSIIVYFFAHASDPRNAPTVSLLSQLNDPATHFLPCEIDGHVELIQLRSIEAIALEGDSSEVERLKEVGAESSDAIIVLASGGSLAGTLLYEAPQGRPRVSDLLNTPEPRFLTLVTRTNTVYVHRRAIFRVRS